MVYNEGVNYFLSNNGKPDHLVKFGGSTFSGVPFFISPKTDIVGRECIFRKLLHHAPVQTTSSYLFYGNISREETKLRDFFREIKNYTVI